MADAPPWEYLSEPHEERVRGEEKWQQEHIEKDFIQVIGQVKNTYILCQTNDGLLLLDQHAAHERIVYETLKSSYQSSRIECQAFLIPQQLELSLEDSRIIQKCIGQLAQMGLELEHFGGRTFILRSAPSVLINTKWDQFLMDLIPILEHENDLSTEKALDQLLTIMACHSAIRAGQHMSNQEMTRLLEQLEKMNLPTNCPHGRPIFKKFSFKEIDKMFKRIV